MLVIVMFEMSLEHKYKFLHKKKHKNHDVIINVCE